ncbi:hypothetical protein GN956_G17341 [Arapaima gigas]
MLPVASALLYSSLLQSNRQVEFSRTLEPAREPPVFCGGAAGCASTSKCVRSVLHHDPQWACRDKNLVPVAPHPSATDLGNGALRGQSQVCVATLSAALKTLPFLSAREPGERPAGGLFQLSEDGNLSQDEPVTPRMSRMHLLSLPTCDMVAKIGMGDATICP